MFGIRTQTSKLLSVKKTISNQNISLVLMITMTSKFKIFQKNIAMLTDSSWWQWLRRRRMWRRGRAWLVIRRWGCRFLFDCFTFGRRTSWMFVLWFASCCGRFRWRGCRRRWAGRTYGRFGLDRPLQRGRLHHTSVALLRTRFQCNQVFTCSTCST